MNRISQDGQWGDEVTLRAVEQCNGRGVRVLSDNEQNPVINPTFEGPLEDTITITHYGEVITAEEYDEARERLCHLMAHSPEANEKYLNPLRKAE